MLSQDAIIRVYPPVAYGTQLLLSWASSAPLGTIYQVYVNLALVWHGTGLSASVPLPTTVSRIDIGTVEPGEGFTNFAGSLAPLPNLFAELSWLGGTFESASLAGFRIFGEPTPGAGVDFANPLGSVPAYTAGVISDGFGNGGFGEGGFGAAAGEYGWTSRALAGGTWTFAVVPYDSAGNLGAATLAEVTIAAPPLEPAPYRSRERLRYTFDQALEQATLVWLASPSA